MSNSANERVRAATVAALAAYTASSSGTTRVLTANANGAIAAVDGVTLNLGDALLLTLGASGADNGVWYVSQVGTAGAPFILTRSAGYQQGMVQAGYTVDVTEGTLYSNTTWKLTTAGAITVDTTATAWYPRIVTQQAVLVAGTVTIANVPLLSATKSAIVINRTTANTTASTIAYNPSTLTPGAVGTASIVVQAQVAAGTINNVDVSTLNVSVVNW